MDILEKMFFGAILCILGGIIVIWILGIISEFWWIIKSTFNQSQRRRRNYRRY